MLEMLITTFFAGFVVVVLLGHVMLFKAIMKSDPQS